MPEGVGQGNAPASDSVEGQDAPFLSISEAQRNLSRADTLDAVIQLLQRIRPPISWATKEDVLEELPLRPDLQTIRRGVMRMLGHEQTRREERERNKELMQSRQGGTRKRKRKHFRKRTSRRH